MGVFQVDEGTFERALETNKLGPSRSCRAFVPAMVRRGYGRAVNASSGGGSFGEGIGPVANGAAGVAQNALTVKVAEAARRREGQRHEPRVGPHRHGRRERPRSPEQAADTLVWLATLPPDGPNGGFFRDREPITW